MRHEAPVTRVRHRGGAECFALRNRSGPEVVDAPGVVVETPPSEVVVVEHLTKRFGSVLAVDDLSFRLEAGTVTGFLGPNGAGKTTTLRMLLGLVQPTAGTAHVFGHGYREHPDPSRRVGAVLEAADFHPGRIGREHLITLALAASVPLSRVDELLDLVELTPAARRRVGTYSLGMRQRLGLAAALLRDPGSTPRASTGCARSYAASPRPARRCSSRATFSPRWLRPSIAS